ncbi:MAG: dehydrogenase [Proteobacteria bacterium]|nr:dehydrogenase [Pseudomonadota bacterium]
MYTVGVSRDFLNKRDEFAWGDVGLSRIEQEPDMQWRLLTHASPDADLPGCADLDAMLVLRQKVDAPLLAALPRLRHVSRWGAGLDRIDLDACTRAGVIVTSTPHGGRRPVAAAAITLTLALTHRLIQKDRLTREGRWADRADYMGVGLTGRVVGIIGLGNIGRDVGRLLRPFETRMQAYSPRAYPEEAEALGIRLVGLEELMRTSDVVIVTAALTPDNHGLLSKDILALMKSTAFLVNVGRGELIDEEALIAILEQRQIAGAGLDVFQTEPLPVASPLTRLDNVILAPHAIAWTDEIIAGNAVDAIGSLIEINRGRRPAFIANPAVLKHERFRMLRE